MNYIGPPPPPESRDVKGWCSTQRPSSILVCVGGTAKRSSSLLTPSHDCRCTNPTLRKHVFVWWEWHVDEVRPVLYASLVYREVKVCWGGFASDLSRQPFLFIKLPYWRSDQTRHHQLSARQSSAHASPMRTAPRLIRGATDRRKPLNKLPNPCPLWTRSPVK